MQDPNQMQEQMPPDQGGPPPEGMPPDQQGPPPESDPNMQMQGPPPDQQQGPVEAPKTGSVSDLEWYLTKHAAPGGALDLVLPPEFRSNLLKSKAGTLIGLGAGTVYGGIKGYRDPKKLDREHIRDQIAKRQELSRSGELSGFAGYKNLKQLASDQKTLEMAEYADKNPHTAAAIKAMEYGLLGGSMGAGVDFLRAHGPEYRKAVMNAWNQTAPTQTP